MKFKLDENLPTGAERVLADAGHDVSTVLQERLGGKPDSRIAETCKLEWVVEAHRVRIRPGDD